MMNSGDEFTDTPEEKGDERPLDCIVDPVTGNRIPIQPRVTFRAFRNDERRHDFVQINLTRIQIIRTVLRYGSYFMAAILPFLWLVSHYIFEPRFKDAVEEVISPLKVQVLESRSEVGRLQETIDGMRRDMLARTELRWTILDQQLMVERFRAMNPNIKVPDPVHLPLPGEIDYKPIR